MNLLYKASAALLLCTTAFTSPPKNTLPALKKEKSIANPAPKIQVAILLDVSNSMDGLIEQAKAQLWNMVSVMGKAKCNEQTPQLEIALYEYGRTTNDAKLGYVKQISPFTRDLDQLSKNLFALSTNGGDEYCGHVMYSSLTGLQWDTSSLNYKVIFIAGNEDFLQGDISYTKACTEAKKKGVVINTVYCGDRQQGIAEHWNLLGECGNGNFTNINQDATMEDLHTPYDSTLMVLNNKLNKTYIGYGSAGSANVSRQAEMDKANYSLRASVGTQRAVVKANGYLYNNAGWDIVDAVRADSNFIAKVDTKTLPDSLKNKSRKELGLIVQKKNTERGIIQKEMQAVNEKRELYIAAERKRSALKNNSATLETEMEKMIRQQAARFNMKIK